MAAAAATLTSSQERALPLRIDNPFCPPPSAQPASVNSFLELGGLPTLQDIDDFDKGFEFKRIDDKGSCDNVVKLQHLADKQRIQPAYEYDEVLPQNFKAKVLFGAYSFDTPGLFPSKQQAKDAAAKIALEGLPSCITNPAAGIKRKAISSHRDLISTEDKSENWIGILTQNFAQKKKFEPKFFMYETNKVPPGFLCEVRLNGGPIELFKASGIFSRRQDAKAASSKLAVEWLRSNGHLEIPAKRPKLESLHTGLSQALGTVNLENDTIKPQSFRQRVYELAAELGFQQPACQLHLCVMNGVPAGSFYDAVAIFAAVDVQREPALAGPIGRVERVYGQKKAREACSERVLLVLAEIKQRRAC